MAMTKCPKCGNVDIDHGTIDSAGPVAYRSSKQKTIFVKTNCLVYVCNECGYAEIYVDQAYRDKMKGRK
jgi:predicted nucleic-acid-binding Zn-ribbon protein